LSADEREGGVKNVVKSSPIARLSVENELCSFLLLHDQMELVSEGGGKEDAELLESNAAHVEMIPSICVMAEFPGVINTSSQLSHERQNVQHNEYPGDFDPLDPLYFLLGDGKVHESSQKHVIGGFYPHRSQ